MGQNAEQNYENQRLGSVEVFVADYGDTVFISAGIGEGFAYTENITPLDGRPDNGVKPDVLRGAAEQTAEVTGTLWTYDLDVIEKLRGGLDVKTVDAVTGETKLATGGIVTQESRIIKLVNKSPAIATAADVTRWVTTPTTPTVSFAEGDRIVRVMTTTFYKTNFTAGENITYTADQDANPIMKYPFTMTAEEDETITAGDGNLFERVETVELPA